MSKTKKFLYALISALLVFSLLCSFYYTADEMKPVEEFSREQIKAQSVNMGYHQRTDADTGTEVYQALYRGAYILLPRGEGDFNTVVIRFSALSGVNDKSPLPRLYYSVGENGRPVADNFCEPVDIDAGSSVKSNNTVVFKTEFSGEKNALALSMVGDFSIESVSVYNVTGDTAHLAFSPAALIFAVLILVLCLILEKKLGYFAFLGGLVSTELAEIRELRAESKRLCALKVSSLIITVIFALTVLVLIALDCFTKLAVAIVFALGLAACVLSLIYRLTSGRGAAAAKLFLVLSIIIGTVFCYTAPTTTHSTYDDEVHFSHAYGAGTVGSDSTTLAEAKFFSRRYPVNGCITQPQEFIRTVAEESQIPIEYTHSPGNPYTYISYLPMILSVALAKLLQADMVKILVLCKLANLLAFSLIAYSGIKKLKSGALLFCAVCLLPAVLFSGASVNYDFWLTAWFIYCFAYIISLLQQPDKKISPADCAKILIAFFVACSPKAIYCFMLLPLLFIKKNKFQKPSHAKVFRIFTVLTLLLIVAILVLPGIFVYDLYADVRGGENIHPTEQFMYVLKHPIKFAGTLLSHLFDLCSVKRFNIYSTNYGFLDGYNGSNQMLYGTVALMIIAFCIFTERRRNDNYECRDMQRMRPLTISACILQVIIICCAMYAAFNDVGAVQINGTQFRYLFPLLAPALFFLAPKKLTCEMGQTKQLSIVFGGLAANLFLGYITTYLYKLFIG